MDRVGTKSGYLFATFQSLTQELANFSYKQADEIFYVLWATYSLSHILGFLFVLYNPLKQLVDYTKIG